MKILLIVGIILCKILLSVAKISNKWATESHEPTEQQNEIVTNGRVRLFLFRSFFPILSPRHWISSYTSGNDAKTNRGDELTTGHDSSKIQAITDSNVDKVNTPPMLYEKFKELQRPDSLELRADDRSHVPPFHFWFPLRREQMKQHEVESPNFDENEIIATETKTTTAKTGRQQMKQREVESPKFEENEIITTKTESTNAETGYHGNAITKKEENQTCWHCYYFKRTEDSLVAVVLILLILICVLGIQWVILCLHYLCSRENTIKKIVMLLNSSKNDVTVDYSKV